MEWRYLCSDKQENNNSNKEDTPAPQITHKDKSNKTAILNNMYQKSVAVYIPAIIPKY